jgi:hypothetical protein
MIAEVAVTHEHQGNEHGKRVELTGLRAAVLRERASDTDNVLETIPKRSERRAFLLSTKIFILSGVLGHAAYAEHVRLSQPHPKIGAPTRNASTSLKFSFLVFKLQSQKHSLSSQQHHQT